jgi:LytS/YehU family sensor histidine kinase
MSNIAVNYKIEGDLSNKQIEPLVLLPFIENAFKHGINALKKCDITILVRVTPANLLLIVENPVVLSSNIQNKEREGIGLANSKKRLQLLYGANHQLNILQNSETFKIELNIYFKNELHHS